MGADKNGLPFMGFIEAKDAETGDWKRIDVLRYRNQSQRWSEWRECAPNFGTAAHPCSMPPPPDPQPSETGTFPPGADFM